MDLWSTRDKVVLEAVTFIDKRDQRHVQDVAELAQMTGLGEHVVRRSLGQLMADELMVGASQEMLSGITHYGNLRPTPEGYRRVGEWPSGDLPGELLRALEVAARETEDDDERDALAAAASSLGRVGADARERRGGDDRRSGAGS